MLTVIIAQINKMLDDGKDTLSIYLWLREQMSNVDVETRAALSDVANELHSKYITSL